MQYEAQERRADRRAAPSRPRALWRALLGVGRAGSKPTSESTTVQVQREASTSRSFKGRLIAPEKRGAWSRGAGGGARGRCRHFVAANGAVVSMSCEGVRQKVPERCRRAKNRWYLQPSGAMAVFTRVQAQCTSPCPVISCNSRVVVWSQTSSATRPGGLRLRLKWSN